MPHAYTEDQLVEQPAIGLFATLGWQTVSAMVETFGAGGTLGRETKGEVVLTDRLRAALTKLNAGLVRYQRFLPVQKTEIPAAAPVSSGCIEHKAPVAPGSSARGPWSCRLVWPW